VGCPANLVNTARGRGLVDSLARRLVHCFPDGGGKSHSTFYSLYIARFRFKSQRPASFIPYAIRQSTCTRISKPPQRRTGTNAPKNAIRALACDPRRKTIRCKRIIMEKATHVPRSVRRKHEEHVVHQHRLRTSISVSFGQHQPSPRQITPHFPTNHLNDSPYPPPDNT
jgi:hypothetical protein